MATLQQLANYVQTTLASGCTNAATTLSVVSAAGLPTVGNFMLRIDDPAPATTFEYVEIASVSGTTLTTSTNGPTSNGRGMEGTTGIAHNAGAFVGNDLTAAMILRAFPWGTLPGGNPQQTTSQGSIAAQVDLTGLSATVTVGAGRRLKLTGYCASVTSSVNGDTGVLYIMEGASQLVLANTGTLSTANGQAVRAETQVTPTAGTHTYKLQAARSGGTGNLTFFAANIYPMFLLVEDIGQA